jgi:hypothetical protein
MLRYYVAASAIVVVAILILLALPRPNPDVPKGSQYHGGPATPRPGGNDPDAHAPETVGGVAPWALSAVPECFHQTQSYRGNSTFAAAKVPRGARRIAPGTRILAADCVLDVGVDSARLSRGDLHFIVPPRALFFRSGGALVLRQTDGKREEVRIYCRPRVYSCT